ncbi:MAG: protein-methionine-sulfoxide reductase catalytic subunit MsrP [Natronospirillum sp.]
MKASNKLTENDVTPKAIYMDRRKFMTGGAALIGGVMIGQEALAMPADWLLQKINQDLPTTVTTDEAVTPIYDATHYNNYFEFGTGKSDPVNHSGDFQADPWTVEVSGHCRNPGTYDLEDIARPKDFEERIYRLRCVEAWSMVIPWLGFSLADLIERLEPTSDAKYVAFETLHDPEQYPNQRSWFPAMDYPYVEGLRLDEAMNPLAFMAMGMYGENLPNQNGAPMRLVVPWKYGFKSIKAIVAIRFTAEEPPTSWNKMQSREYGFYANVNPNVDHPRWSQATERRLPSSGLSANRIPTRLFNGYEEEVAHLYSGMDLTRQF